jgi:hypothetical protein
MHRLRFEPTILKFQQAKTFHTLGRAATLISQNVLMSTHFQICIYKINYCVLNTVATEGNKKKLLLSLDCVEIRFILFF